MKKDTIKRVGIVVACVYALGSTIFFGGNYLKSKELISLQEQNIMEITQLHKEESEKVVNLITQNQILTTDLDYARQRTVETRAEIKRVETEIANVEKQIEADKAPLSRGGSYTGRGKKIMVKVTGYCPCYICCGQWAIKNPGITASGTKAKYGTIAAPKSIPFGTRMKIDGFGDKIFTVEDTGSAVVYKNGVYVIDVWMPTHSQAYAIGNKTVEAIILD